MINDKIFDLENNKLKFLGIIIAIIAILIALIVPGTYRNAMEKKYKDDITTTQVTVMTVSFTSEYHRGGKGSRGATHYIYKIFAISDGEVIELLEHDVRQEKLQIERNDIITVYCLNDKYAYAPEDFYVMSDLWKTLLILPMFVGLGLAIIGSFLGKKDY